jgi:26S proteasome regulatory subunit N9
MTYLEQKVRIIAFLEMIFECAKNERSIPFSKIAAHCLVEESDVEFLVMKAMSLDLIKGTINEVDQVVHVEWCQPRYLSKSHLQIMVAKMADWEAKLDSVVRLCENNAVELGAF